MEDQERELIESTQSSASSTEQPDPKRSKIEKFFDDAF